MVVEKAKEDRVEYDQERHHSIKPGPFIEPDAQLPEEIAKGKPIQRLRTVTIYFPPLADYVRLMDGIVNEVAFYHLVLVAVLVLFVLLLLQLF